MRAAFSLLLFTFCLACSSGSSGTTTGGTGGSATGGSSGGGPDAGGDCPGALCASAADCASCGAQFDCSQFTGTCCGVIGYACAGDDDCCSGYCETTAANLQICENLPGTATAAATATAVASSGSTGGTAGSGTGTGSGTSAGSLGTSTGASSGVASTSGGSGPPQLAFRWTFGAGTSALTCESAGIGWIALTLNGGTPTSLPCRDLDGIEGSTLPAAQFFGALVDYEAIAIAVTGSGTVQMGQLTGQALPPASGTSVVPIQIPLATGSGSAVDLAWTFNGLNATQSAIGSVDVGLTGTSPPESISLVLDAGSDAGLNGATVTGLPLGSYALTLAGNGPATYTAAGTVIVNGVSPSTLLADLTVSPTGNSGVVVIDLSTSFNGTNCLDAGEETMSVQLAASSGAALVSPAILACADAGVSYVFPEVPAPGTAFLWVEGLASGQTLNLGSAQVLVAPGATSTYSVNAQLAP